MLYIGLLLHYHLKLYWPSSMHNPLSLCSLARGNHVYCSKTNFFLRNVPISVKNCRWTLQSFPTVLHYSFVQILKQKFSHDFRPNILQICLSDSKIEGYRLFIFQLSDFLGYTAQVLQSKQYVLKIAGL